MGLGEEEEKMKFFRFMIFMVLMLSLVLGCNNQPNSPSDKSSNSADMNEGGRQQMTVAKSSSRRILFSLSDR